MNRKDYRAHVAWHEGIRDREVVRLRHVGRNGVRPEPMKPRKRWRVVAAALVAAAAYGAVYGGAP